MTLVLVQYFFGALVTVGTGQIFLEAVNKKLDHALKRKARDFSKELDTSITIVNKM